MSYQALLGATLTGTGPHTIVFGNGFSTTQSVWDAVVRELPAGWRALRFDYVGTTPASAEHWIAERYTQYDGHADDLVRLLSELGVEGALFVGHSMSGMIGLLAAQRAPQRIRHVLLMGASPCYRQDGPYAGGLSDDAIADLLHRAEGDLAAWMGGFAPVALGAAATPADVARFCSATLAIRPDIGVTILRSIFTSDHRPRLGQLQQPVTVVQGLDDPAVPVAVGRFLAATLPCVAYHELDVPGHLPHVTHPSLVVPIVRATCDAMAASAPTPVAEAIGEAIGDPHPAPEAESAA